jgi:hypothetical protein
VKLKTNKNGDRIKNHWWLTNAVWIITSGVFGLFEKMKPNETAAKRFLVVKGFPEYLVAEQTQCHNVLHGNEWEPLSDTIDSDRHRYLAGIWTNVCTEWM